MCVCVYVRICDVTISAIMFCGCHTYVPRGACIVPYCFHARTIYLHSSFSISTFLSSLLCLHLSRVPLSVSQEVALMPKGSYLINASRGEVVKVVEVAAALRSGHLVRVYAWMNGNETSAELHADVKSK